VQANLLHVWRMLVQRVQNVAFVDGRANCFALSCLSVTQLAKCVLCHHYLAVIF
jgi:hypothetical protein